MDNTQILRARRIIQHPYYDPWASENDIAIIEIGMYIEFPSAPYATPACLPSIPVSGGEPGMVSGFGITEQGTDSLSLKYVYVNLINSSHCNSTQYYGGGITEDMICAGGEAGKDACQGDSGGPLAVYNDGKWELWGVVSWGYLSGVEGYPGVYANVHHLKQWI